MDLIGLFITAILILLIIVSLIFAIIADSYEDRQNKRSEKYWKEHADDE